MPRVARNYQHKDYSVLLMELQNIEVNGSSAVQTQEETPMLPNEEVSAPKRRRSSLMDKREMNYAYSLTDGLLHDRDCPIVKQIADNDFAMRPDYTLEQEPCRRCYRKAIIRSGIHPDDTKLAKAYFGFFDRIRARDDQLFELLIKHNAKLSNIQIDSVTIKVLEDRWKIKSNERGEIRLLHNDYEVFDENNRYFDGEYHIQYDGGVHSFAKFVSIICGYSWEGHKEAKAKKDASRALRKKIKELRMRLSSVKNVMKLRRFSLFHSYYAFVDCNNRINTIAKKQGVSLHVIEKTTIGAADSPYTLAVCKVKRWQKKEPIFAAIDALKEYSIAASYFDYADYCLSEIKQ